jgi:MerR family transcriptional regulator, light-induced transcriptional regulator
VQAPSLPSQTALLEALVAFDETSAVRILDEHRERAGLSSLVGDLVLPVMRQIGEGWERGEVSVAQEHLATQTVRSYLDALRRTPVQGGPQAWLACPPRELHDLPLLALGLLLRDQGWQVRFFGANTPLHDLLRAARIALPDLVVVSGDDPRRMRGSVVALDLIAAETALALGGRAAEQVGDSLPGRVLPPDVVLAAEVLREELRPVAVA